MDCLTRKPTPRLFIVRFYSPLVWACLLLLTACHDDQSSVVLVPGGARVILPSGWKASRRAATVVAMRESAHGERVDISTARLRDRTQSRTAASAMVAVVEQAKSGLNAEVQAPTMMAGAARVDWLYEYEGRRYQRRHWIVELERVLVHVSCRAPTETREETWEACDRIARSAHEDEAL